MDVLYAALGFAGVVILLGAILHWLPPRDPRPAEADLAAPYREALHAAMRMQSAAYDMERQLYVEAMRFRDAESSEGHRTELT
jgi:hypothetical protein